VDRDSERVREEMIKHVREVEKDLLALQKKRNLNPGQVKRLGS
jgi:hypothetical protein